MAYDMVRSRTVLFGGWDGTRFFNDTWEWNGQIWIPMGIAGAPSSRWRHQMVYDSVRRRVVLFGGVQGITRLDDTWEWDGVSWRQVPVVGNPPLIVLDGDAMTFDVARGRTVLFVCPLAEMWEYDGLRWTWRLNGPSQLNRFSTEMGHDPVRQRTLLFGGFQNGFFDDTWEWDGIAWTQRSPVHRPQGRERHAIAYDGSRGRLVMFGGRSGGPEKNDVWEWDGSDWLERRPMGALPPPRTEHAMTYHSARQETIVFGGRQGTTHLGDTWIYQSGPAAAFTRFGSGCPASQGVPDLGAAGGQLPWVGENFTMEVHSLPATASLTFGMLGASRTVWGTLMLPIDLAAIGMPGCNLRVGVDVVMPLVNSAGVARWTLQIPNDPSLHGTRVFVQAGVADPLANALGVALANAGEVSLAIR